MKLKNKSVFIDMVRTYCLASKGSTVFTMEGVVKSFTPKEIVTVLGTAYEIPEDVLMAHYLGQDDQDFDDFTIQYCNWIVSELNPEYKPIFGDDLIKLWKGASV